MLRFRLLPALGLLLPGLIGLYPGHAQGFGSGLTTCEPILAPKPLVSPKIVTACTEAGLRTALRGGGHITFACGPGPVTIPIATVLELDPETDTLLDGGGLVTLDGQNLTRLLHKGWHDPSRFTVTVTLQNLRLIRGKAPAGEEHSGGAFYGGHPNTRVHLINSTFAGNTTTASHTEDNQGGAVFVHNSYETVISGCNFTNNRAGNGGAFGGIATGLLVFNSSFTGNQAVDQLATGVVRGHGGAIHLDGVTNDYNPDSHRRVQVCGSVFTANTAVRGGGALKVTVSDNKGTRATYERSTFVDNSVSGSSGIEGHGGAIYHIEDDRAGGSAELNLELLANLFSGNRSWRQGGGTWFTLLGEGRIINNTFVANRTTSTDLGMGGALCLSDGSYQLVNNTLADNYAWFHGGGIQAGSAASLRLQNNLFYGNESTREWACYQLNRTTGADIDGGGNLQYPATRFNQAGGAGDCPVTATALVANPGLAVLADNGGPTRTMAIAPSSPAVNGGSSNGAPTVDQRGFRRDQQCDIGAYESGGQPDLELADVLRILQLCAGRPMAGSGLPQADINQDGKIGLAEAVDALHQMAR